MKRADRSASALRRRSAAAVARSGRIASEAPSAPYTVCHGLSCSRILGGAAEITHTSSAGMRPQVHPAFMRALCLCVVYRDMPEGH